MRNPQTPSPRVTALPMKCILLFSGGLDSMLAAKILQRQNIDVIGLNFVTPFHDSSADSRKRAEMLGIELVVHHSDDAYLKLVAKPQWGYGKAVNPCIDCRVEMCRVAKKLMEQRRAMFVATGEIAGQRPNSQMQHQLNLIARASELDGLLLRPLSAGVLPMTRVERDGMVDRSLLHRYTGRGRGRLIALAHRYEIKKIPQPSTGCFLCEKSYAPRLRDLFAHEPNPTNWDAAILNAGRQFRISPAVKGAMGRNEEHCNRLKALFERSDAKPSMLFEPSSFFGPSLLLVGPSPETCSKEEFETLQRLGGSLILRYTNPAKYEGSEPMVRIRFGMVDRVIPAVVNENVDKLRVI